MAQINIWVFVSQSALKFVHGFLDFPVDNLIEDLAIFLVMRLWNLGS